MADRPHGLAGGASGDKAAPAGLYARKSAVDPLRSTPHRPADPLTSIAASSSTAQGSQAPSMGSADCRSKAQALYQCGLGRLKLGDTRGAYEDFKEAARLEPRDLEIWQKYEETYRAVESEVEEELATFVWSPSRPSAEPRQTSLRQQPPHHFSLRRPSEVKLDPEVLQAHARGSLVGEDAVVDMQARALRPVHRLRLGRSGSIDQGSEQPQQPLGGTSSSSGPGIRGAQARIEVKLADSNKYMAIHLSWVITSLTVLYHYRVQLHYRKIRSSFDMALGTVLCALVTGVLWWFRKRRTSVSLSLTDAVKMISLVIIAILTVYHYCSLDNAT